jgi:hypothetical protein
MPIVRSFPTSRYNGDRRAPGCDYRSSAARTIPGRPGTAGAVRVLGQPRQNLAHLHTRAAAGGPGPGDRASQRAAQSPRQNRGKLDGWRLAGGYAGFGEPWRKVKTGSFDYVHGSPSHRPGMEKVRRGPKRSKLSFTMRGRAEIKRWAPREWPDLKGKRLISDAPSASHIPVIPLRGNGELMGGILGVTALLSSNRLIPRDLTADGSIWI